MNIKQSFNATNVVGFSAAFFGAFAIAPGPAIAETELGMSLVIPKLGEFIPMLVVFLIVWFVLAKFAWPTILGMLDQRAAHIKDSLESAEATKVEANQLLEEYKAQLALARRESAEIVEDARRSGEKIKNEITEKAAEEAEQIVAKARVAIENEKKAALLELQSSIADVSVGVAGRLIGENLSDEEHRKLIERYVKEAGTLDAN